MGGVPGSYEAVIRLGRAFRPATPIDTETLFAGRKAQMERIIEVVSQAGRHAVIYGIRGVGKTSLARVMTEIIERGGDMSSRLYTCNSGDTFDNIWRSVLADILLNYQRPPTGFTGEPTSATASALDLIAPLVTNPDGSPRTLRPDDVRRALEIASQHGGGQVIVIDEFDRVQDHAVRRLFADTIKALSDRGIDATIVLVGVADSVDQLVDAHPSIERSIAQIHMPTMSNDELAEIIDLGMSVAELTVEDAFRDDVVRLAHGLPNYVHLLAQNSARVAIDNGRTHVLRSDLDKGIARSLTEMDESVLNAYHRATSSNRETIYKEVLLACALARRDERDTFSAVDVREQLAVITGRYREIPAFAGHLKDFAGEGERGGILERLGRQRRYRYRFRNPLLPPFVLMKARLEPIGTGNRVPM